MSNSGCVSAAVVILKHGAELSMKEALGLVPVTAKTTDSI